MHVHDYDASIEFYVDVADDGFETDRVETYIADIVGGEPVFFEDSHPSFVGKVLLNVDVLNESVRPDIGDTFSQATLCSRLNTKLSTNGGVIELSCVSDYQYQSQTYTPARDE